MNTHIVAQQTTNTAARIEALIAAADAERWLSWHGPACDRARHEAEADRHLEQLRRISVDWSRGRDTR